MGLTAKRKPKRQWVGSARRASSGEEHWTRSQARPGSSYLPSPFTDARIEVAILGTRSQVQPDLPLPAIHVICTQLIHESSRLAGGIRMGGAVPRRRGYRFLKNSVAPGTGRR